MPLRNIPVKETVLTAENISAITQIEQLKRLLKYRRFSAGEEAKELVELDRTTYIRLAIDLGKQSKYSERKLRRLGHELNRSFAKSMTPQDAEEFITHEIEREPFRFQQSDWTDLLGLTQHEFELITKQRHSAAEVAEIFE